MESDGYAGSVSRKRQRSEWKEQQEQGRAASAPQIALLLAELVPDRRGHDVDLLLRYSRAGDGGGAIGKWSYPEREGCAAFTLTMWLPGAAAAAVAALAGPGGGEARPTLADLCSERVRCLVEMDLVYLREEDGEGLQTGVVEGRDMGDRRSLLLGSRRRRVALSDFLQRSLHKAAAVAAAAEASAPAPLTNETRLLVDEPSPFVLERNTMWVTEQAKASALLTLEVPRDHTAEGLLYLLSDRLQAVLSAGIDKADWPAAEAHVRVCEDQSALRSLLKGLQGVAFVANGSVLPRASGESQAPLRGAMPFVSPATLEIEVNLPHAGPVRGMLLPEGVTLVVGGGFHGKSTLLRALALGVYDKVPGDGRELVVTVSEAAAIRSEDGRPVHGVDVSAFIGDLPPAAAVDASSFSTLCASGSTSQAANVMECLVAGARCLLLDEDTCAANFMVQDSRMRAMVSDEPITPFIYRVNSLYTQLKVSTILAVGGCGEWFDVHDTAVMMQNYGCLDVTSKAVSISKRFSHGRVQYAGRGLVHRLPWPKDSSLLLLPEQQQQQQQQGEEEEEDKREREKEGGEKRKEEAEGREGRHAQRQASPPPPLSSQTKKQKNTSLGSGGLSSSGGVGYESEGEITWTGAASATVSTTSTHICFCNCLGLGPSASGSSLASLSASEQGLEREREPGGAGDRAGGREREEERVDFSKLSQMVGPAQARGCGEAVEWMLAGGSGSNGSTSNSSGSSTGGSSSSHMGSASQGKGPARCRRRVERGLAALEAALDAGERLRPLFLKGGQTTTTVAAADADTVVGSTASTAAVTAPEMRAGMVERPRGMEVACVLARLQGGGSALRRAVALC